MINTANKISKIDKLKENFKRVIDKKKDVNKEFINNDYFKYFSSR